MSDSELNAALRTLEVSNRRIAAAHTQLAEYAMEDHGLLISVAFRLHMMTEARKRIFQSVVMCGQRMIEAVNKGLGGSIRQDAVEVAIQGQIEVAEQALNNIRRLNAALDKLEGKP